MTPERAFYEVTLQHDTSRVTVIAKLIGDLCDRFLSDPDAASRLRVAAHELLENAVRYSVDGEGTINVRFEWDEVTSRMIIDTHNRTTEAQQTELSALFAEMKASPTRNAFYAKCLRRTVHRTDGSGLGLGRIHAESLMDLTCTFDGELTHLHAEATVPHGARR